LPASRALACVALLVAGCGGGSSGDAGSPPVVPGAPVDGPAWPGFAHDAQHAAQSASATQDLNRIAWSTALDLAPQHSAGGALLIHYGSPVVTWSFRSRPAPAAAFESRRAPEPTAA
jgi:hypothetical protein